MSGNGSRDLSGRSVGGRRVLPVGTSWRSRCRSRSRCVEFHATPHYCLRRLNVVDQHARRGGRQYRQFTQAIERLSLIRYRNDSFYDPVRGEHRRVSFGFFSYSLPLNPQSSRAWRFGWDPIFFDLVRATGGHFRFDLDIYRRLDPASRRLLLLRASSFTEGVPLGWTFGHWALMCWGSRRRLRCGI